MRQRKLKNEFERLVSFEGILVLNGEDYKGKWADVFGNDNPVFLEIGCGKGQFIGKMAMSNPDKNYIGIEGHSTVMVRALEKLEQFSEESDYKFSNVRFIQDKIKTLTDYFEKGELSGLYLNFSDPWPKIRHGKRRLTHEVFLEDYKKVLKNDALIEFKSDNDKLFDFSIKQFKKCQLEIIEVTENLHTTSLKSKEIMTEYEEKFNAKGKNINFVCGRFK